MAAPLVRPAGIFEDEYGLHAIVLDVLLLKAIGPKYIAWDHDALRAEISEHFGEIGPVTWEKIQAIRVMHANSFYWEEWEVFEKCTVAICGAVPVFNFVQPPDPEDAAVSLDTAARIATHPFSEDVKGYIGSVCLNAGHWYLEPPLDVAESALAEYDKQHNIQRDLEAVSAKLASQKTYVEDPETSVDVQVNHVLSVRATLEEFRGEVQRQMARIPDWIKR